MEILIPDGTSPEAVRVADELSSAGHVVHHCYRMGDTGVACGALRGRACPVEGSPVDMVVVVPTGALGHGRAMSEGARCALRRKIPLVVGQVGGGYHRWGAAEAPKPGIVAAVAAAADQPLREHSALATQALHAILALHDAEVAGSEVRVWRTGGRLKVVVSTPTPVSADVARALAARLPQWMRQLDPWAHGMDLSIEPPAAPASAGAGRA